MRGIAQEMADTHPEAGCSTEDVSVSELVERLRIAAQIHREIGGQSALAATIDEAAREIERLTCICENTHNRLLRGDDDSELLAILEQAWSAHEAMESP